MHYEKWKKVDLFDTCAAVVLNVSVCRPVAITGVLLQGLHAKVGVWEIGKVWGPQHFT